MRTHASFATPASHAHRIVVIGAGVAGLSAARALRQLDYDVVVLEARDRPGGRCWTVDRVDLGAHWLHSTEGNPISTFAREADVPMLFVGGDSTYPGGWERLVMRGPRGSMLDDAIKRRGILAADDVRERLDTLRRRLINESRPDISMADAVQEVVSGLPLDPDELQAVAWHLALLVRDDVAADPADLSFLWWDDGYEVYGYGDSAFSNGYGDLVTALAVNLDIRFGHQVCAVDHRSAMVRVTTTAGATFEADAVIVTLPLGVLKNRGVAFEPPLPPAKQSAVERLGVGTLNKIVAWYDSPFWPPDQYAFGSLGGDVERAPTTMVSLWKTQRVPALVMLLGGAEGRAMETWSDTELLARTTDFIRDVFGTDAPPPRRIDRTRWHADPFARGAYAYVALGSTPADIDALAQPVGERLFFAGEATSRQHWATVHSAYVSGLREAARISGRLEILPPRNFTENRRWREMMARANRFFEMRGRALPGDELADRVAVLGQNQTFAVVPPGELEVLATMFDVREFVDQAVICTAGEPAREVFVIASGAARVMLEDGACRSLARGDAFGEYGMFAAGARTATVRASEPTVALALDYQLFRRFLLSFPESMAALMTDTVERLLAQEAKK